MPSATLALAFLVAGYFAVSRFLITGLLIKRAEGHPQYFLAAAGAAILFGLSVCVDHALTGPKQSPLGINWVIDLFMPYFAKSAVITPERRTFLHVEAALVAGVLCWVMPAILNFPLKRNVRLAKFILARYGQVGPLETFLDRCIRRQHPVMLTQSSGKVYIGYVLSTAFEETNWIRILPVFSGYRDEHHEFVIATDYLWVQQLESQIGRLEVEECPFRDDFDVLVKLDTLTSVHPYDLRTHFNKEFVPYAESPLMDEQLASTSSTEKEAVNPSGEKVVLPDWYHHPTGWDPPYVSNYEDQRRENLFKELYPKGKPVTWLTWRLSVMFQRRVYIAYVMLVLAIPIFAATGDLKNCILLLFAAIICAVSTSVRDERL